MTRKIVKRSTFLRPHHYTNASEPIRISIFSRTPLCAAGVVVSCKIPILATRVRFPGGASKNYYFPGFAQTSIFLVPSQYSPIGGCSSVVERSLCMWKAPGSIPGISTFIIEMKVQHALFLSVSLSHQFCLSFNLSASACANLIQFGEKAMKFHPFLSTAIPCWKHQFSSDHWS